MTAAKLLAEAAPNSGSSLDVNATALGLGVLLTVALIGVAAWLILRPRPRVETGRAHETGLAPPVWPTRDDRADGLALAIADIAATVPDEVVASHLTWALEKAGYAPVVAQDGDAFDPSRHNAVGRRDAANPGLHNRIACTARAGLRLGDRLVRLPDVDVYRAAGGVR